jgi:DNA-binding protein H-NS
MSSKIQKLKQLRQELNTLYLEKIETTNRLHSINNSITKLELLLKQELDSVRKEEPIKTKPKARGKSDPRITVKIVYPETYDQKEMEEAFDWLWTEVLKS